ncbi:hypothetical protein YC2023_059987 [Brassica napus]
MSIVGNSTVSESSLENDDNFLSLTPFQSIINGSLDSIFLIVQITNAFETSSVVINPDGFDVQDYLRLPTNELALSTVTRDVVKPKGKKRQIDKWSLYPERSDDDTLTNAVSSDRSSGPVSLISIESENNTCLSSTPLSKRRVDSDLDDISSTSKKQCFKIIKVEKNNGE